MKTSWIQKLKDYFITTEDGVYVDDTIGVAGTVFPIGTAGTPVDTLDDALLIAAARNLRRIYLFGWHTLNSGITGYEFIGRWERGNRDAFDFNGQDVDSCLFRNIYVEGATAITCVDNTFENCVLWGMVLGGAKFFGCAIETLNVSGVFPGHRFFNCWLDDVTLDSTGVSANPDFLKCSGELTITNIDSGGVWKIFGDGLDLTIAASCTTGTINIYGNVKVTDNSGGTTVNDYTVETAQGRQLFTMDFWSLPQEEVAVVQAAGDKALPSVTVADLPGGATIVRAVAMFKFRMVEAHTFAGENKLDGAQKIQVEGSVDAINFVDTQFTLAQDTREGGDVVIGIIDIVATVNANGAYAFHWDLAKALQTGINFNDVQVGLRIWYSV